MTTESAGYWGRLFIDVASQLKTRSWAPASATPNEVWTRRWFSPTRCSWVPAKNAPATNAPTTTMAKIATASAIPRSSRKIRFMPDSFMGFRSALKPPVISQCHTSEDAIDHGRRSSLAAGAHGRGGPGADRDVDPGNLVLDGGHVAIRIEVLERQTVREH